MKWKINGQNLGVLSIFNCPIIKLCCKIKLTCLSYAFSLSFNFCLYIFLNEASKKTEF